MQPTKSSASQPWESTAALFNLAETHGNTSCQAQVLKQPSPKLHNSQFSMAAAMHQSRDLAVLAGQVNVGRHLRYLALVPTGPLEGLGTLRQNSHHARTCGINCKRNRHMQPTESPASQSWELQPLFFFVCLRHPATSLARRRCRNRPAQNCTFAIQHGNGDAPIKGPSSPSRSSKRGTASQTYLALVPTGPLEGLGTLRQNSHHARTCSALVTSTANATGTCSQQKAQHHNRRSQPLLFLIWLRYTATPLARHRC